MTHFKGCLMHNTFAKLNHFYRSYKSVYTSVSIKSLSLQMRIILLLCLNESNNNDKYYYHYYNCTVLSPPNSSRANINFQPAYIFPAPVCSHTLNQSPFTNPVFKSCSASQHFVKSELCFSDTEGVTLHFSCPLI